MEKNATDNRDIREIDEIIFGVYSAEEIKRIAVCEVNSSKLCGSDKNTGYGTVYDPRMGTIENGVLCSTCDQDVWRCSGHFGYIQLNEAVIHPLHCKRVVDFLRCFCIKCFKLLMTEDQIILNNFNRILGVKRFNKILEKLEKIDMCPHCTQPQPDIRYTATDGSISMVYKQKDKEKSKISIVLPVDEIKNIFDNVSISDVELLGFDPNLMQPKNLILTVFPVIPTSARPYVISESNICDDDLTIQLVEIIKANNHLKIEDGVPVSETKRQKYVQSLKFRIATFYNNSSGKAKHSTNGRVIKGLKERLTGKEGLIRTNLMGKRCFIEGTEVLMWDGSIKKVENIKIGDNLIGDDGKKRKVLNLCSGEDKMYKIIQRKGEEYIVNSEHILSLKYTNTREIHWTEGKGYFLQWFNKKTMKIETKKMKPLKTRSKEECLKNMEEFRKTLSDSDTIDIQVEKYMKLSNTTKNLLFGYRLNKSVDWSFKKIEIDPYILGMWLGDGHSNGRMFTTNDIELLEKWEEWANNNNMYISKQDDGTNIHYGLCNVKKGLNNFKEKLKIYNLVDNKHIPHDYIYNDTKSRLSVLAGLIDTEGSVEQEGVTIRISQSYDHKDILLSAQIISRSLGFQTSLNDKKTSWKNNGNALVLTISGDGIQNIPTILSRKKCKAPKNQILTSTSIKVEPYKISKFYGFEVDQNSRFLLKDFTVVHNCEQSGRTVIGPDPTLRMGQLAVPEEMASNLSIPVQVTDYNKEELTQLVNNGKANYVLKDNGNTRLNLEHKLFYRGTSLNHGDIIIRTDHKTGEETEICVNNGKDSLRPGDRLKRNGEFITDIKYPEKRVYHLNVGDIVERQLIDGDHILLNRQPTLHEGSMMAQEVVIRKGKTLRFNLSIAKAFNADEK